MRVYYIPGMIEPPGETRETHWNWTETERAARVRFPADAMVFVKLLLSSHAQALVEQITKIKCEAKLKPIKFMNV